MTLLPIRAFISLGGFAFGCFLLQFVMIGHDFKKPTTGTRGFLRKLIMQYANWVIPKAALMEVTHQTAFYDYEYYLGKDYQEAQKKVRRAPTVVANHQSWIDNMILVSGPLSPGMAAKAETKKVWVLYSMIKFTQGIFINRGGTKEEREQQIKQIIERQEAVEKDPDWNPICIYPEGTQSNGSALL